MSESLPRDDKWDALITAANTLQHAGHKTLAQVVADAHGEIFVLSRAAAPSPERLMKVGRGSKATVSIGDALASLPSHALQNNAAPQADKELPGSADASNRSQLKPVGAAPTIPSTTPQKQEGEHKSLAGQAIEMAISALRDIHRRAPGTRTFFDYEAFIERELVPAMEMADKDRQGCIGLMGLLAKEKLKVEELKSAASATACSGWMLWTTGDGNFQRICRTEAEVIIFIQEAIFGEPEPDSCTEMREVQAHFDNFTNPDNWSNDRWDLNFEDGGVHALKLNNSPDGGKQTDG